MQTFKTILFEKQRRGVLITLNRRSVLNAMNRQLKDELQAALEIARDDEEIRAVVITGAGDAFSVGDDMNEPAMGPTAWPYGIPEGSSLGHVYDQLRDRAREEKLDRQLYRWQYPKPIIAAVSGWCLGSASWLALSSHLTIAAEDAVFGQPQVRHSDGTDFIWTVLGKFKNALRYGLTGDHIDAKEALRLRMINKVAPRDQLVEECFRLVERIALVPPDTVKINLQKTTSGYEMMGLAKAWSLNAELSAMAQLTRREEFYRPLEAAKRSGGLKAFFDMRDAAFQPEPFGPRAKKVTGNRQ
jgi:enoyl-CoA hydratase/carnithine racemase